MPDRLRKFIVTLAYGKRTGPVAYVHGQAALPKLPKPVAGAEWSEDTKFNAANEVLAEPGLKALFKTALEGDVAVKTEK